MCFNLNSKQICIKIFTFKPVLPCSLYNTLACLQFKVAIKLGTRSIHSNINNTFNSNRKGKNAYVDQFIDDLVTKMKCSGDILILSIALNVLSFVQTDEQRTANAISPNLHAKDLLSESYDISSGKDTESSKTSASAAEPRHNTVNIPVPFHRVHYHAADVARPLPYSKKPDVYVNHVHVHNGGQKCHFL